MVEIPVHRLPNSTLETDAAAAAEFVGQPGRVDRVTLIVAGAIGDKADQRSARAAGGGGAEWKARGEVGSGGEGAVDRVADRPDYIAVVALVATADIVGFAGEASLDHLHQRLA